MIAGIERAVAHWLTEPLLKRVFIKTCAAWTYDALIKINPEIKVLLASGYSVSGEASRILGRGCNAFIQKPFNIKQLNEKIRHVLDTAEYQS